MASSLGRKKTRLRRFTVSPTLLEARMWAALICWDLGTSCSNMSMWHLGAITFCWRKRLQISLESIRVAGCWRMTHNFWICESVGFIRMAIVVGNMNFSTMKFWWYPIFSQNCACMITMMYDVHAAFFFTLKRAFFPLGTSSLGAWNSQQLSTSKWCWVRDRPVAVAAAWVRFEEWLADEFRAIKRVDFTSS